ncbi:transcription regulator, AraC family [Sulfurimonas gotlandica GD1]|uniref:Transcription regulator, AraC family n=1 Tax=Sulfurimonas gotlandica (strain DSM 19862 / JCM 16533 / GD1) TaxID=929558 RepID=B6BKP0_SULGG|nr:GyrI-like domain-containing protein [Sulfurimonas gotlandica]EDZ62271.1 transcriptional regulator, AraC family [Sulfurimonas gotlandica GD1]EHP29097.1 transcription regulator, AraC family [Sulfurimonas gotlandica GD1]
MKRDTLQKNIKIANSIMYYIYTHIDVNIDMDELSKNLEISKFHMHKVFKNIFGKNIYESIKSIRLQKAASLLLTNKYSTISEVANLCGYSSHSSFIKAFRNKFDVSPKEWRNGAYIDYSNSILQASNISTNSNMDFSKVSATIVNMPSMKSYYIRNNGYINNVKETWQKLYTLILNHKVKKYKMLALLHDNPTITDLNNCQYIACIITDEQEDVFTKRLPKFKISDGVYAKFDLQGQGEDILRFIQWVYHDWLVDSEYETTTKPSFIVYHKNNYLNNEEIFDISYYLSIKF